MTNIIIILLIFMIIAAVVAIETRDILSAVISLGAVGIGQSIAFLFLGAPDLVITLMVAEVLCLIILIRATIRRDITSISEGRGRFSVSVGVVAILIITLFGLHIAEMLPAVGSFEHTQLAGNPTQTYISEALSQSGAANSVMAVLLDYRAYDTLGEVTVLFIAVMGVWVILRKKGRKETDET